MQANELRRRAIAVVAKLTIFAGAAGCTGNVILESEAETDTDTETGGETSTPTATSTLDLEMPITPTEPVCSPDTATVECCHDVLAATFTNEQFWNDPMAAATAQDAACCEVVVTFVDTWDGSVEPPPAMVHVWDCCAADLVEGGWMEHPACSPWGPPMPPRMPPARRALPRPLHAEVVA